MRIDPTGSSPAYQAPQSQPQQVQTQSSGTEAKTIEKPKMQNSTMKNSELMNRDAELAAEIRAQQNEHEVIQAITKANKHIRTYDRRLEFSIHDMTKQIMVKVINTEDDTVIREIPSEKVLDMVAHMWEVAGILIDEKR
jgi:flagellar protein FlaG